MPYLVPYLVSEVCSTTRALQQAPDENALHHLNASKRLLVFQNGVDKEGSK